MKVLGLLTFILLCENCVTQETSYTAMLFKPAELLHGARNNKVQFLTPEFQLFDLKSKTGAYLAQASRLAANESVSGRCINDSLTVFTGLMRGEQWSQKVIDSAGKIPPGFFQGNIRFTGAYDECVKVKAVTYDNQINKTGYQGSFNGRYCTVPLVELGQGGGNPEGGLMQATGITYDLCVPDSCSEKDVVQLLNSVLSLIPTGTNSSAVEIKSAICHHTERKLDTGAVTVLTIVCVYIVLMLVATLFDVVFIQWPQCGNVTVQSALVNGEGDFKYKIKSEENSPLLGDKTEGEKYEPGICAKLLLSFSVYTNGSKILDTSHTAGTLTAVNGIRFLSMSWVILGHSLAFGLGFISNIGMAFQEFLSRYTFQAINNALVSVDSFFVLSGLLVTYLALRELKRNDGKLNWPMFYFHRFWRLTPPYALLMMVYIPLIPYLSNGPFWPEQGFEPDQCKHGWYFDLLYVNNFQGNMSQLCMAWTWYLANDMQFYVISPLIILPLYYSQTIGLMIILVFTLATCTTAGIISSVNNLSASMFAPMANAGDTNAINTYFVDYYIKPYCRMGPYLMGMLTGYLLYKTDCRYKMNKYLNLLGWAVATTLACLVVYGLHDDINGHPLSRDVAALYNATHRTVWGMCLCWVIFTCATGNGGFVNTLLSWTPFSVLSRLTYCAYLIHPIVMYVVYCSMRETFSITDLVLTSNFLSHLVLSYMAAFVLSLSFESPMMALEKVIFKRKTQK